MYEYETNYNSSNKNESKESCLIVG